ncbi:MAG TPA: twin-arginine translocase TatA/TatE family subunit [Candidatus Limnocylindria bacterium]|nr:twin-arginine translocase TatA/TatE family subunit [Candidatus Limnocylindria bacterium]
MLSIPDMAILGAAALLLFGPEQLPRVLRKAGQVTREIQNTSQAFIREMERAADTQDTATPSASSAAYEPPPYAPPAYEPPAPDPLPVGEKLAEPRDALEHAMAHPQEAALPPEPAQPEVAGPEKPHLHPPSDPAPY